MPKVLTPQATRATINNMLIAGNDSLMSRRVVQASRIWLRLEPTNPRLSMGTYRTNSVAVPAKEIQAIV